MESLTNSVYSTIDTSIRMAIFNNLQTNDHWINTCYTMVMLTAATYLINFIKNNISKDNLITYLKICEQLFYKKNRVKYEGKISTVNCSYAQRLVISNAFSENFKALWDFISKQIEINNINNDIYEIKEFYSNCNSNNDIIYVVSQEKSFLLDEPLQIYAKTVISDEENQTSDRNDKKTNSKTQKIVIELYSYVTPISNIKNFVHKITENYLSLVADKRENQRFIYDLMKTKEDCLLDCWMETIFETNRNFNNFFFDGKEKFLSKIEFFLNNREWHEEMGIPYTLGIGLHGPPGTGKTSVIKALAKKTGRHIVNIPLKLIKNSNDLIQFFFEDRYNRCNEKGSIGFDKKIIVFEDIDCIGEIVLKRKTYPDTNPETNSKIKNINFILEQIEKKDKDDKNSLLFNPMLMQEDQITLDNILNLWDGIRETPGRIIVITSNHYDKLDPALTRPGRIDLTLELSNASHEVISDIYFNFFKQKIDKDELKKIKENFYSPAEINNIYLMDRNPEKMMTRMLENRHV